MLSLVCGWVVRWQAYLSIYVPHKSCILIHQQFVGQRDPKPSGWDLESRMRRATEGQKKEEKVQNQE